MVDEAAEQGADIYKDAGAEPVVEITEGAAPPVSPWVQRIRNKIGIGGASSTFVPTAGEYKGQTLTFGSPEADKFLGSPEHQEQIDKIGKGKASIVPSFGKYKGQRLYSDSPEYKETINSQEWKDYLNKIRGK